MKQAGLIVGGVLFGLFVMGALCIGASLRWAWWTPLACLGVGGLYVVLEAAGDEVLRLIRRHAARERPGSDSRSTN